MNHSQLDLGAKIMSNKTAYYRGIKRCMLCNNMDELAHGLRSLSNTQGCSTSGDTREEALDPWFGWVDKEAFDYLDQAAPQKEAIILESNDRATVICTDCFFRMTEELIKGVSEEKWESERKFI